MIRNPFSEELRINGHKKEIKIFEDEEGFTVIEFNNKKYLAEITDKSQNKYKVLLNGVSYSFTIESPISYRRRKYLEKYRQDSKLETVIAPMPGKIVELLVEESASVKEGDSILILEAMKMQNEIISQVSGKIKKINVKPGDTVTKDDVLLEITRNLPYLLHKSCCICLIRFAKLLII